MPPNHANDSPRRMTPSVLKKILIGLLIICAIAGYAGSTYIARHFRSDIQPTVTQTLQQLPTQNPKASRLLESFLPNRQDLQNRQEVMSLEGVRDLFKTIDEKDQTFMPLTFQGTLAGKSGAIAIINDQPLSAGTDIRGVIVQAISNQFLILEYKGETKELKIGETVSVLMN